MKPKSQERASVITLQAHPPERRRRRSAELLSQLNGCCCCCCCCLHSVGSLVGAVVASVVASRGSAASPREAPIKFPDDEIGGWVQEPPVRLPIKRIYWGSVVAVASLVPLYMLLQHVTPMGPDGPMVEPLFYLAIFLPLVQLGASVLSAIVLACFPYRYQNGRAWALLGWITAGTFIGAVIGTLIMILAFFSISHG
jgi:hypothetical protein